MDDALYDPVNDDLPDDASTYYRKLYASESQHIDEIAVEQDEERYRHRNARKLDPTLAALARKTAAAARERFENAARTTEDFQNLIAVWDKADKNRERREQYREVLRGDLPLDYGKKFDGAVFPQQYMNPAIQQINRGQFLDVLFDCPYEMHELTADAVISNAVYRLKKDHKEIFYFLALRLYSATRVADMRGQTDRNIRKVRATIMKRIRKPLYEHLKHYDKLTLREREFVALYEATYGKKKEAGEHESV